MNCFKKHQPSPPETEIPRRFSDVPSTFNRRQYNNWRCLCPRRYILALMLLILLVIHTWRNTNIRFTMSEALAILELHYGRERFNYYSLKYPFLNHWAPKELVNYRPIALVIEVFAQMPGALLIFRFSSHKFLLISIALSSILHMFVPVALNHHLISLLFVLIAQTVTSAPTYIAVMTVWRDWAPPVERTKLLTFSLYGLFISAVSRTVYPYIFEQITTDASYYLAGISGIIWVLFWFNITSDTPQNNPLISEEEIVYLENNIPSDNLHKIRVRDIPWKIIIFSKPVLVLGLIWFKVACSMLTVEVSGWILLMVWIDVIYDFVISYGILYPFILFVFSFGVLIPCSAILADWLVKKFSGRALLIRRIFLCGGFFLQCFWMLGTLIPPVFMQTIFYMVAYSFFAMSIPGFITIALDLSPRYVPVIAGILFTFYALGCICVYYFIEEIVWKYYSDASLWSFRWLLLFDGILSLLCIIFFALWGDIEEQPWSLTFPTNRRTNGYRSYPEPEDQQDTSFAQ